MSSLSVDTDIPADEDLLGKVIGDLQSDIVIRDHDIIGTLNYVTGYTGFSGDPEEQSGNYLALHFDTIPAADSISVELVNGRTGHPVTLDPSDNILIVHITDKDTQYIKAVATKDSVRIEKEWHLSGLTLLES